MSDQTGTRGRTSGLRSLGNSQGLLVLIEGSDVVDADDAWLTIKEVVARLHAAGYTDSSDTVRRMVDVDAFGPQGEAWYRTELGRYRKVSQRAVDALIARRRGSDPAL